MTTLRLFDGYQHTSGDLREDVKRLQRLLGITADGYFGSMTEQAVLAYQTAQGLEPDGIVGRKTWAALTGEGEPDGVMFDTTYRKNHAGLQRDAEWAGRYRDTIEECAVRIGVPLAIIVGIGSRESAWGAALGADLTGDLAPRPTPRGQRVTPMPPDGLGFGRGLMQIDYDAHEFARTGPWRDHHENIRYGCEVLRGNLRQFVDTARVQLAIAAYNCGAGNVRRAIKYGRDVDYYTAHRNYSADVLSRAGWFQLYGGW